MQTFTDKDRQLVINQLRVYVICFEYLLDRLCENIIRISLQRLLSLLYYSLFANCTGDTKNVTVILNTCFFVC